MSTTASASRRRKSGASSSISISDASISGTSVPYQSDRGGQDVDDHGGGRDPRSQLQTSGDGGERQQHDRDDEWDRPPLQSLTALAEVHGLRDRLIGIDLGCP